MYSFQFNNTTIRRESLTPPFTNIIITAFFGTDSTQFYYAFVIRLSI